MAELVRDLFAAYKISQEAAHWMAVLAMEQYAYFLADGTGVKLVREIGFRDGVSILLPYPALLEGDLGMEHTWDYTSDSVAALFASKLGMDFVKATDVDGIILDGRLVDEISASQLLGIETCLDQGALRILISSGRSCRVMNGSDPEAFLSSLTGLRGGTLVRGL
jgi:aspartokinase-like uncharacterized kinase